MARRKSSRGSTPPKYRLHKPSGKAVVSIHGKVYYLGQHGTRESRTKYKLLIADLWAKDEELMPIVPSPFEAVRVGLLAVEFAKYAKKKYRHQNGGQKNEWFIIQNILTEIRSTYGDLDVDEFGPRRFESYRQSLVAKGLAKHTVKRYSTSPSTFVLLLRRTKGGEDVFARRRFHRAGGLFNFYPKRAGSLPKSRAI